MDKIKVAFFGTPKFSTGVLESLYNNDSVTVTAVITGEDKKSGRGQKTQPTPVAEFCEHNKINVYKTASINSEKEILETLKECDLFIVLAFSQFLSQEVLNTPKIGSFNIHTSLLPKYRGAAPIQYALLNGDKETGICIQKMVKKMDAGEIVLKETVEIAELETSLTLFNKLEKMCMPFVDQFIELVKKQDLKYVRQNEDEVSYAPTIKKQDGLINFKNQSHQEIVNKIKAFTPWPGTYTYINDMRIKIHEVEVDEKSIEAGIIDTSLGTLTIGTQEKSLRIKRVQLEGKKTVNDFEFVNGHKNKFDQFQLTQQEGIK
jgi:methionyl-tRNA formyltransferase